MPDEIKSQVAAVLDGAPPHGLTISELQGFLARKGFTLDYRGLGYKQLLTMMQAMPDVVAVTIPAERSTKKKYFLRPAVAPEFLKSAPVGKVLGGGLRAEVSMEVRRETAPETGGAREAGGASVTVEDKDTKDKLKSEAGSNEGAVKLVPSTLIESRQKPFASLVQLPFFRKVVSSFRGLLGRRPTR